MPFEETTFRTARDGGVVTATIFGATPETLKLQITMSVYKAAEIGLSLDDRVRAFVGSGEDAGHIQIKVEKNGPCRVRRSGGSYIAINCGHHSSFDAPREKAAVAIERGEAAIDITLPTDWRQKDFARRSAPKANGGAASALEKAPKRADVRGSSNWMNKVRQIAGVKENQADVTSDVPEEVPNINKAIEIPAPIPSFPGVDSYEQHNGVTVSFALNEERVTYGGKSINVTTRQAHAVERMARSLGKQIGRSWLMNEIFPGKKAAEVHMEFDKLILSLKDAVPKLGLMLIEESLKGGALMYSLMRKR